MSHREEASGKTQDTLEKLCLSAGLGTPRGPPEELEEVSGVREVWASLLRLLPPHDPVPDQADEEDEEDEEEDELFITKNYSWDPAYLFLRKTKLLFLMWLPSEGRDKEQPARCLYDRSRRCSLRERCSGEEKEREDEGKEIKDVGEERKAGKRSQVYSVGKMY
ncbi:hypothetical protein L3Q82_021967 [Scortum barcoo]|uniref:Uncharacterized protein n=1 Tax=Scortum barcoo TaxID=214431 RepID=A0ACB8X0A7_9TELE|nr:hypothetical protein L3Q82_021967 [Scortum barcoo]